MHTATDARILLTHSPQIRALYYRQGPQDALSALGAVTLHDREEELSPAELIAAAAGARVIVAHRATPVPQEVFAALPDLVGRGLTFVKLSQAAGAAPARDGKQTP